ncbi:MAG TPA: enoyl-CoA hydratase-related protein [Dehalococcoidia bacterium]|nr:enoyl-CoA hydratase-related protein [Dehalococcoidia bacterium]
MTEVLFASDGHVATITVNRPEAMNALNRAVREGLAEAIVRFRDDPELWVAIVTGAGERAFSAGADLVEMSRRRQGEFGDAFWEATAPGPTRGLDAGKPVIAAINGYCLAGGLELALACDIRIAADHAQFGLTEVTRGIIPGSGGTQRLPRLLPLGAALELLFTGDRIPAQEALRLGLVNRVVPATELIDEARRLADRINQNAPLAVRAVREAAYRGLEVPLEQGLRIESFLSRIIRDTEDSREGPRAFAEKRPARFQGR